MKYTEEEEEGLAICPSNILDHYHKHVLLHTLGCLDSKACLVEQLTALVSAMCSNGEISYDIA